jgi:hypothetical protein
MSDQTTANQPASDPILCKMGCGFFVRMLLCLGVLMHVWKSFGDELSTCFEMMTVPDGHSFYFAISRHLG